MRALALCIAAIAIACGGGKKTASKPKDVGPAIDEKTAEKDARGLATEVIDNLGRGNKDSLMSLLDPAMFVFGPRRVDAYNRTDALVELGKAKKKLALKSGKLEVVASPGGHSAYAVDTLTIEGVPHAVTAILVNTNDFWQIEAALIAPTPTWFAIKTELAKDAVVPVGAVAKGKVDPNANGAVDRYRKGLLDQDAVGGDLTSRSESVFINPAGEVSRGKKEIKELWAKRLEAKTRAVTSGDVVAQVTPDGKLAWVSSPITQVGDKGEVIPMRAFAVFEKTDADWKLVVLHEAVAFDEAGAGAAFKKTLPPPPKEGKETVAVKKDKPKDDDEEKPKGKKDDKKIVEKKVDKKEDKKVVVKDDDEEEDEPKPKPKTKKQLEDERKKKAEEDRLAKKQAADEKRKKLEEEKAEKKRKADEERAAKKKADEEKRLAKKEAEDEKKRKKAEEAKAKTAKVDKKKKPADDDEEEDKPRTKGVDGNEKNYERYPGKKRPEKNEDEQYEEKKKAAQKKAKADQEKAEEDRRAKKEAEDEKIRKKKEAEDEKIRKKKEAADEVARKKKEAEEAKKAKKKKPADDEEDEKPAKKKKPADDDEEEDVIVGDE